MALALKFLAASVIGVGGAAGGWIIYNRTRPVTIGDKFNKDGFINLSEDREYKAVLYDQRKRVQEIEELKSTVTSNDFSALKTWCENQRGLKISANRENPHFANLCTTVGITSIRGYITQHFPSKWIDEEKGEEQDKLYKIIFVVYKYNDEFLRWINGDVEEKITKESPTDKFAVLKNKCSEDLSLSYKAVGDDIKYYKWWCQPLPYKTIKDKLQHGSPKWKLRENWDKVSELWNKNKKVRETINPNGSSKSPNDDEYKKWCKEKMDIGLEQEEIYPKTYTMVRGICSEN